MSGFRILVTGVGGDIGVNIARCLLEGPYANALLGCDMQSLAFGRRYLPAFEIAPSVANEEAYVAFLDSMVHRHHVKYVYPGTEAEIRFLNKNRELFKSKDIVPVINNPEIIDTFLDKLQTAQFFHGQGIAHPQTTVLAEYADNFLFPLVLKKRFGSGSKLVLIVHTPEELAFYRKKYTDAELLVQEYIGRSDAEYTGGVFSDGNEVHSILFRRSLASDAGITLFAELADEPKFDALAKKVAKATRLRGAINIQCRKVGDEFVPFEVNPRISGTAYIRHHFGFKDTQWWLSMLEGGTINYTPRYKKGVAVRAISEVFLDVC